MMSFTVLRVPHPFFSLVAARHCLTALLLLYLTRIFFSFPSLTDSTLDATSVLINLDMRDLWKKKLGIDRTRVPFSEFCDAFLSAVRSKVKEVRVAYLVDEKVGRFRAPCDVVLARFLNECKFCVENIVPLHMFT